METALIFLWVVGLCVCGYFIAKPNPEWGLVSTRGKAFTTALCVFLGIPIISVIFSPAPKPNSDATTASAPSPQTATQAVSVPSAPAGGATAQSSKWRYSEDTDAMRGTKTKYAMLESEDQLEFGFPYGSNKATLVIRQRPSDGLNIILEAKGQFLCNRFNSEHVSAKFDALPIETYGCSEPSDASTGVLFIEGSGRFLAHLKKAKSVIVEAPFFQNGRKQVTFDVRGLEWK